jgi:hypothetical protein
MRPPHSFRLRHPGSGIAHDYAIVDLNFITNPITGFGGKSNGLGCAILQAHQYFTVIRVARVALDRMTCICAA